MLGKDVTVVGLDEVTKEDGIIDHHGGDLVKRNCQLLFIAVLDLLGKELLDSGGIHAGGVNDLANLELGPLLEDLYGDLGKLVSIQPLDGLIALVSDP